MPIIGSTTYTGKTDAKMPKTPVRTETRPSVDSVKQLPLTNGKGQPQALNPRG